MRKKNLFFSLLGLLTLLMSFTSCSNEDDSWNDIGSVVELPRTRAFVLNSGSYNGNNSGLAFYAPNKNADFISNIYLKQNKKELGDTGQSMIEEDGYMYILAYGSKRLVKLNSAGVEIGSLSFSNLDGGPRDLVYVDGKLYVTLYSGKVARINAETLVLEDYVAVGLAPENIVTVNGKLYVAICGWTSDHKIYDKKVVEVDIKTFKVSKEIEVTVNPNQLKVLNGNLFLISWGNWGNIGYDLQKIDLQNKTYAVTHLGVATKMTAYGKSLYLVNSVTDWVAKKTVNTFFSYDDSTGKIIDSSFLKNAPEKLASESVYMMEVNPNNGEIYIGVSNYQANGDIYRFDASGQFIEKFDCGGLNPMDMAFFN